MVLDTPRRPAEPQDREAAPGPRPLQAHTGGRGLFRRFLLSTALLLLVGALLIGGLILAAAGTQNRVALDSERHLAHSALAHTFGELGRLAVDYALWDEAIVRLLETFDADWAQTNIGPWMIQRFALTASLVLDQGDRLVFAAGREGTEAEATFGALSAGLAPLIAAARRAPAGGIETGLVPATGVALAGSLPYLVAVAAFTPERPADPPADPAARGVLIVARAADPELLAALGEAYGLRGLALAGPEAAADSAAVPLAGPDGRVLAALVWGTAAPGAMLVRALLPALAVAIAVLAVLVLSMVGAWRRAIGRIDLHERHLAAILDGAADAIVTIEPDGRVAGFNAAAERIFGRPAASVVGRDAAAILPDAAADRTVLAPGRRETRGRRADGSDFDVEIAIAAVAAGEARLSCGILRDITRRKAEAAALHRARWEAEIANHARSAFLATMSHELRTPLNAIIGFSEILVSQKLDRERVRDYAGDIRDSGVHLLQLIDDILEVSRIEIGRETLREGIVRVADSVSTVLRLVAVSAEAAGVALVHAVPQDLPPLRADERKLNQMLLNLLSNAIKFTPAGGTVTVLAGCRPEGGVAVTVADTGIGIPAERIEEMLRPFTSLESEFTRTRGGAGLGLALTKGLIELHGGSLILDSKPDRGTRVTLLFPAERADAAPLAVLAPLAALR